MRAKVILNLLEAKLRSRGIAQRYIKTQAKTIADNSSDLCFSLQMQMKHDSLCVRQNPASPSDRRRLSQINIE